MYKILSGSLVVYIRYGEADKYVPGGYSKILLLRREGHAHWSILNAWGRERAAT